jgi:hypothetical protein
VIRFRARFRIAAELFAFAALLSIAQSRASVIYDFSTSFDNFSFQYVSPDFITTRISVLSSDLSTYSPSNVLSVDFSPNCIVGSTPCDSLFLNYNPGGSGTGNAAFYFPNNAFSADGSYDTILATDAALIVSGSPDPTGVPEPSSIVLLLVGLLGLGAFRFRIGLPRHFSFAAGSRSTTSIDTISSGSPR